MIIECGIPMSSFPPWRSTDVRAPTLAVRPYAEAISALKTADLIAFYRDMLGFADGDPWPAERTLSLGRGACRE
jgi:hypothetical protein